MRLKWLHISDIHFSYAGYDTFLARDDFLKGIRQISEHESFTDLFITGDILYRNMASSDETIRFLDDIVASMGITKTHVWIVPGNHDHCRDICNDACVKIYGASDPNLEVDKLNESDISGILGAFGYFEKFCDSFYGSKSVYAERKLHWCANLQDKSSVIGLNTAWLENDSRSDAYIKTGLKQLKSVFTDVNHDSDVVNIAIGHHPIDKLYKYDQDRILELFRRNNVKVYLCGHEHDAGAKYYEDADVLQIDAAGMLVDDFSYGGYCVGTIDTSSRTQRVEFFRWSYSNEHWNPERGKIGVSIDGICYFERIKKRKEPENIVIDAKLIDGPILDRDIYEALKDESAEIVRFTSRNVAGVIDDKQWNDLRGQLRQVKAIVNERRGDKQLSIFPLAPIPLLVEMGYLFQRNSSMLIWQYDRMRSKWVQNDRGSEEYKLEWQETLTKKSGELIASVSTSVDIFSHQIDSIVSADENDSIQFYSSMRQLGYPLDANKVRLFAQGISTRLTSIIGKYSALHLFLAVPAGLAVEIGRWIQSNIYPEVHLYHYKAGYQYAYTINGVETNHQEPK